MNDNMVHPIFLIWIFWITLLQSNEADWYSECTQKTRAQTNTLIQRYQRKTITNVHIVSLVLAARGKPSTYVSAGRARITCWNLNMCTTNLNAGNRSKCVACYSKIHYEIIDLSLMCLPSRNQSKINYSMESLNCFTHVVDVIIYNQSRKPIADQWYSTQTIPNMYLRIMCWLKQAPVLVGNKKE